MNRNLVLASADANLASASLMRAHALRPMEGIPDAPYAYALALRQAVGDLARCAAALGYELVPATAEADANPQQEPVS